DGDLDILPNGTTYAAWYEFAPSKQEDGTLAPKWIRHNLPPAAAGHGIGFGEALVPKSIFTAQGRAIATAGDWRWQSFSSLTTDRRLQLHADASVPILVSNAPSSKAAEYQLIWGRGHRTGLYQATARGIEAIDTSWSQCHAPLFADINNDGQPDLVAGKRYLGHEGKDPGEYDPLVIYWYEFQKATQTWQRHVIDEAGPAGLDLDPKVIDLDGDGDLDLIAPSRHGLYYYENLLVNPRGSQADIPTNRALAAYTDHSKLLIHATDAGDLVPAKTPAEWGRRRWHVLRSMEQVMGPLPNPSQRVPLGNSLKIEPQASRSEKYDSFRVRFQAESDGNLLAATLLVPRARGDKPLPAMLCLHPTSLPHGKKVATGEFAKENRAYAHELAERGFVCLCPDYPTMGENAWELKADRQPYRSGSMQAIWENVRCLDLLEALPYVDGERIGAIGHSLGGHNSLFTACFDLRIKCVVTSCGFTPFHDYKNGKLAGWTSDRYMPRIRDLYANDPARMPFNFYEVLAAIAPRPIFICAPLHDDNFDVTGVKKAVLEASKVYDLLGKQHGLVTHYPDCQHDFPTEARHAAYDWLAEQLK
ncbi:MAG TPA: alpha/beta fold hydrolase, partial [Pirellulaceae bacterium]|nr:alpha/beta fold hydrolase [Pirellulaceae bacterium]